MYRLRLLASLYKVHAFCCKTRIISFSTRTFCVRRTLLVLVLVSVIITSLLWLLCIMWQDLRKGALRTFPEFWFKNAYISGTIAAMSFKPSMNIHSSSYYTRCKLRASPTSGVDGASVCVHVRKSPFYAPLWRLTASDSRLTQSFNVGSVT